MSAPAEPMVIVVTDSNVLINFFHIGQLPLLGKLNSYRFRVPQEVIAEVDDPAQAAALDAALKAGHLAELVIDDSAALELFAGLRALMGRGEAACLAAAATSDCLVASDEKKRFKRKAIELLGEGRLLRTEDLIVCAIRAGHVTVAEADGFIAMLAANRYALPFASFVDLL